jgi:peroxiredoxin
LDSQTEAAEQEWLENWKQGPAKIRWTRIPVQIGDKAPDFKLLDFDGKPVYLHDFCYGKPALLLFWRHFGCGCGMDRAKRLQKEYSDYLAAGGNVVIIGQGEPDRAKAYARKYEIPCPILCDPERSTYEAYGLLEGKPSQILYDAPEELARCDYDAGVRLAKARRDADRPLVDSPWQLPGEFVVCTSGDIHLAHRYQYCEDFPNPLVLLSAVKEAKMTDHNSQSV